MGHPVEDRSSPLPRRVRRAPKAQPVLMVPVKGVGRYEGRDYCKDCGHTHGRCICHPNTTAR